MPKCLKYREKCMLRKKDRMNDISKYDKLKVLYRGISTLYNISKNYTRLYIVESVLQPVISFISVILLSFILDEIQKEQRYKIIILELVVFIMVSFICRICLSIVKNKKSFYYEELFKNEKMYMSEKTMQLSYEDVESKYVNSLKNKIENDNQNGYNIFYLNAFLGPFITNISNIVMSFLMFISIFLLARVGGQVKIILLCCIVIQSIAKLLVTKKINVSKIDMYEKLAPNNILDNYYNRLLEEYQIGKDIRIFKLQGLIINTLKKINISNYDIVNDATRKIQIREILLAIFENILKCVIYIIVVLLVINYNIQLGDIVRVINGIVIFSTSISDMACNIQSLFNNNKYLKKYFEYLDLPSYEKTLGEKIEKGNDSTIEFENVCYKYNSSNEFTLKNINFKIREGERVALVGANGSGKTTIIKLLSGLYQPQKGNIKVSGKDIGKYLTKEYRNYIGIMFQDFKIFSFTMKDNICMNRDVDDVKLKNIIEKANLLELLLKAKEGIDTYLYKDYNDGHEISGGEAQKIAFARALYKNEGVLVLDEPSSALDPKSEYKLFNNIFEGNLKNSVLLVSHRMGICRRCDKIIVLKEGEIIQEGKHEELIKDRENEYYKLWNAQAQYYE